MKFGDTEKKLPMVPHLTSRFRTPIDIVRPEGSRISWMVSVHVMANYQTRDFFSSLECQWGRRGRGEALVREWVSPPPLSKPLPKPPPGKLWPVPKGEGMTIGRSPLGTMNKIRPPYLGTGWYLWEHGTAKWGATNNFSLFSMWQIFEIFCS